MADDDSDMVAAALHLIQQMGNVESARILWNEFFEEAERIHHNQSLGDMDDWERAVVEQANR